MQLEKRTRKAQVPKTDRQQTLQAGVGGWFGLPKGESQTGLGESSWGEVSELSCGCWCEEEERLVP